MHTPAKPTGRSRPYYITTAIDYPNAPPHLGHALEKVAADVLARFHRLQGDDTFFSIGLDENSQHVATAAEANGVDLLAWINSMDEAFRRVWNGLEITYDHWIRTTEARHSRAALEMFRRAQQNGDIYISTYSGWYCPNCNAFYTHEELVNGRCPLHPTLIPEWLEEENYFFALTKYADRLQAHINEHPDFIVPATRKAEVLGFLRQGLRDFSVSRLLRPGKQVWGIPVPGDAQHIIYVWFDALTNYLTAIGFPYDQAMVARYWPTATHVIGKDVIRFHCLYWPAMLMSAGLPLPRQIAIHGFLTLEGQRISKTTGNTIDPLALVDEYGADAVRYYLLRNLSFASDGDFSRARLIQQYNDELANDLGNLLNRVVTMIRRYRGGAIPAPGAPGPLEDDLRRAVEETQQRATAALANWEINQALGHTWSLVRKANQYIEQSEPWRLARQPEQAQKLDTALYATAEVTRLLAIFLAPYIPAACDRIMSQLGLEPVGKTAWTTEGAWGSRPLTQVHEEALLFPRIT